MASVNIQLDGTFQQRSRGSGGWPDTVDGDGSVFNGGTGGTTIDYVQNFDGGTSFTIDRLHFRFDVGSSVPSDGTITAVSMFLYTSDSGQGITDADYLKSKIAKATSVTLSNSGTAATTWDAISYSVLHGDYVDISTTDAAENEFDFGSGDLFDYVVAQHAASTKAAFWHLTKLELEDQAPTGVNTNKFQWTTAPLAVRPYLEITYTPASAPPNVNFKVNGGSLNINGGGLKII